MLDRSDDKILDPSASVSYPPRPHSDLSHLLYNGSASLHISPLIRKYLSHSLKGALELSLRNLLIRQIVRDPREVVFSGKTIKQSTPSWHQKAMPGPRMVPKEPPHIIRGTLIWDFFLQNV